MSGEIGINYSLRESLMQIAKTADDATLSAQQKSEKLAEILEPTLVLLAEKISAYGGTRRILLDDLRDRIQSGDWASLPEPNDVALTIEKINQITAAINDVKDRIAVDASELFRELLEIMRKTMLENKFSQTDQHKLDINAAEIAKIQRGIANTKQKSSELASAITQGIGGVAGIAGAAVSINSVKASASKAMEATEHAAGVIKGQKIKGKSLDDLENASESAKIKLADLNEQISSQKMELAHLKKLGAGKKLTASQKSRIKTLEEAVGKDGTLITKRTALENDFKDTKAEYKDLVNKVETLRKDSDILTTRANAIQSLTSSIGSLVNSTGGIVAAMEKHASATAQQDVDQQNINREVAQKMYQAASDAAGSTREAIRSALSMISAIEQSRASLNSLLARNSV